MYIGPILLIYVNRPLADRHFLTIVFALSPIKLKEKVKFLLIVFDYIFLFYV